MRREKKNTTDHAVVGVVTAILIIGLIVAVISLVQTIYIPKVMEQRESEHMDKVAEQFTYLTSVLDEQAADRTTSIPIATSITLGSKELPYMMSIKAFGLLEIQENARSIKVVSPSETKTFPIGVITYSSTNAYFLDQTYTYEAGAMIVSQTTEGNQMMVRPNFVVMHNIIDNTLDITFDIVNISSVGEKTIAAGYGTYPIQTEYHTISYKNFTNVNSINITTPNSNAWFLYINQSMIKTGLEYGSHFTLINGNGYVKLTLNYPLLVNVFFKIIDIQSQIGPGWVE